MAAIDKIYGNRDRYDEFRNWCEQYEPSIIAYFYMRESCDDNGIGPICNLPESVDMWLLDNCTIVWITDYIKTQYNMDL